VLKPKGKRYTNKSIDFDTNTVTEVTLESATQEDIRQTVKVMGGEDWQLWIEALMKDNLLASGAITVAYSYIGPEVTTAVYRHGTIGAAKDHLEATARQLDERMKKINGRALVSVNKALVTQSSAAIPYMPLYFVLLMKVMKAKGVHEDCIHQMYRLFDQYLYNGLPLGQVPTDSQGRVRIDDCEMCAEIQRKVAKLWEVVTSENILQIGDVKGYNSDFLKLFGFGLYDVDYDADVTTVVPIEGLTMEA
jgi:enoyl-[acyl-carrier protein] reductase/trans-2-enoyl-CoA reductase (NAD+)